ncbi:hypothetical protein [Rhizobium halophytocola]|uniref:Tetratricopeptide (TPR) repeat protein n=1 Tax=Rhizobium halophytocola TaxID=735519 RepID=A0ABS4DTW3_9HYPH|nr:hypothetical protein [Rhizobium halophytocola]MBP1849126.1 tetratricopeptide (TPR) repeat protein [Rhizobium halophytocola]
MHDINATIRLFGPLAVMATDGEDLTPCGKKARALIALLATSPGYERHRRWLEDKLWSDRGPEQASASLRQTLSEIRRTLKGYDHLITIDRNTVRLSAAHVVTDLEDAELHALEGRDFLEGLDVRDPEFEEWLRLTRNHFAAPPSVAMPSVARPTSDTKIAIKCVSVSAETKIAGLIGEMLSNQIGQNLGEQLSAWCRTDTSETVERDPETSDIEVKCHVCEAQEHTAAFITTTYGPHRQLLYSKAFQVSERSVDLFNSDDLARAVFEATERTVYRLPSVVHAMSPTIEASRLVQMAVGKIFSFHAGELIEADRLLDQAYQLDANPAFLAWRALIRNIQAIEMFNLDIGHLQAEARRFLDQALAAGQDNALVLSLAALVQVMLFDDACSALDLARPAMETNPNSAFALQSIAMAQMLSGNTESAYLVSQRSHHIASSSRYGHWWDLFHCLTCVASGRLEEALTHAQASSRKAPNFRPPLRNLLALYGHFGMEQEVTVVAARLRAIEHSFTIEQFLEDENYPNRTLRMAGLLEQSRRKLPAAF